MKDVGGRLFKISLRPAYASCQRSEDELVFGGVSCISFAIPYIVNNNYEGNFAPGTGTGEMDLYAFDYYSLGLEHAHPNVWPKGAIATNLIETRFEFFPLTPLPFIESQDDPFDPWGGWAFAQYYGLLDPAFERTFYKNDFASTNTIFSIYIT